MHPNASHSKDVVLLLLPESEMMQTVSRILTEAQIETARCSTLDAFNTRMPKASAGIVSQEVLLSDPIARDRIIAGNKECWEEFPLLILVENNDTLRAALDVIPGIGNMRLVLSPVTGGDLGRATRSALRDHHRQRQIREQLEELEKRTAELAESELRYDLALRGLNDGVWDWNLLTDEVYYMPRYKEIVGYSYDDPEFPNTIQASFDRIHPEDLPHKRRKMNAYLSGKSDSYEYTFRMRHKDGSYRWILSRAVATYDKSGKPVRLIGGHMDVTAQKEMERQLQKSEQNWRALAEAMPQLVWHCHADGYCSYLSQQWESYTGIPVKKMLGNGWLDVLHPEDRERVTQAWNHAVAGKAEYDLEYRIRRSDGVYRWFKTRGAALRSESGAVERWYGSCTDIQDLVDARMKAEEANNAKTDFLANMSHEIRTPMNAVIGLASILQMTEPLSDKQRECIKTLQLSADALLALINDMLDIAKIEAGSVELEEVPFSFRELTDEICSIMKVRAEEKNISFQVMHDSMLADERRFIGDPARLRQVLLNLASNAIKFTEHGGVEMTFTTEPAIEDGKEMIRIAVRDTGVGIPADKLDNIFQKFVQADSSINRKFGGTGLGLAITKTLIEVMGGEITVASVEGEGSTFTITLPLRVASKSDIIQLARGSQQEEVALPYTREQPCVLLVEDYAANVLVASTFLEQFGYACDVASNGREAIQKIQNHHYAAVLMDVQMHEMNGLEATGIIRAQEDAEGLPHLPIIGMTAHALSGYRETCIDAGMDDYISKPFDPAELEQKLATLIAANSAANTPRMAAGP